MRHEQIVILALESSADETGAAILRGDLKTRAFHLQSNIVYTQIGEHRKTGGIVPEVAAREHLPKIIPSVQAALVKSKLALNDIDVIAVTAGPGLVTSLRIGVDTAKTLAYALEKPLIAVNHLEGHLLSALPKNTEFETQNSKLFPALGLIVSGGQCSEKIISFSLFPDLNPPFSISIGTLPLTTDPSDPKSKPILLPPSRPP